MDFVKCIVTDKKGLQFVENMKKQVKKILIFDIIVHILCPSGTRDNKISIFYCEKS